MQVQLFRKGQRDSSPIVEGDDAYVSFLLCMWGAADLYEVYDGVSKYEDAREFVVRMGGSVRPADGSMTPEEKMRHEDTMSPTIHVRNEMVIQMIARAIRLSHKEHYLPDLLAKNTGYEIIRLFY